MVGVPQKGQLAASTGHMTVGTRPLTVGMGVYWSSRCSARQPARVLFKPRGTCGTMGHALVFAVTGLLTCQFYCPCLACFLPAHRWTGKSTGEGGPLYAMIRHCARI